MKRHLTLLASVLLVIAMVFAFASCDFVNKYFPGNDQTEPEHTHNYVDGKCSECGEADPNYTKPDEEKPECTEHAYGAPEETKAPTCTEDGEKKLTCTVCGATETMVVAPLGHSEETVKGTDATCTEDGLTDGKKCTVCGETTKAQETIKAPGSHDYVEGVCSRCKAEDPDYVAPLKYVLTTSEMVVNNADGSQNLGDNTAIPAGSKWGTDGYFTITGKVVQRVKNGEYVYCVEVGKAASGGIQFTVTGTAEVSIVFHSTSGSNTSWIGLTDADGNLVENNEKVNTVTGTGEGLTVTYTLTAGTYTVCSPALTDADGKDPYNRNARVYSITVTETSSSEQPEHVNKLEIGETNKIVVDGDVLNAYNLPIEWVAFKVVDNGDYAFTSDDATALVFIFDATGANLLCGGTGKAFLEAGDYLICVGNGVVGDINVTVTQTLDPETHNHTFTLGVCKCGAECPHEYVGGKCSVCDYADPTYVPSVPSDVDTVLDFSGWGAYYAGYYKDGDVQVINKYFTFIHSASSRIDSSEKSFDDEFAATQRFNFGGKTETGKVPTKSALQITTEGAATLKLWWVSGGNDRLPVLLDSEGNVIASAEASAKNGVYITELVIEEAGTYYLGNQGGNNYWFKVELVLAEEAPSNEIKVETTDTYGWFDEYSFTADAEGYYTFTIPAGLGFFSKENFDGRKAPELDYNLSPDGGTVVIGLEADETLEFYVGAMTKGEWVITWSFVAGDVEGGNQGGTGGESGVTELVVGSNNVVFADGELSQGKEFTFTVTEEGTYTFRCDLTAVVMDAEGNTLGRGQVSLVPGTYTVVLFSMMPMPSNSFVVNITFEAPATGEPDGSVEYPYVWETLPESVTFNSDTINKVYYVFTSTVNGAITFTWPSADSWFEIYELDADGNNTNNEASGYCKTSHSFLIEAGKTYRVGLGTWLETGEVTVTISAVACEHSWSEATCSAPATCATCGATTGDALAHDLTYTEVASTCTTGGYYKEACSNCDYVYESNYAPSGHWTNDSVACGENATCGECGETYVVQHQSWWNAPTCTADGQCDMCGAVMPATGHTPGAAATCTTAQLCTSCFEVLAPATGHSWVDADCDTPKTCSVCSETEGEALGHKDEDDNLKCETCSATLVPADGVYTIPQVLASAEGTKVIVKGTVSEIYQGWSDQYSNISFYIVDENNNKLLVFRTGTLVEIGDQVTVTGTATLYNNVIQIAQGGTTVIDVKHVCSDFDAADCLNAATCKVCDKENGESLGHSYVDGACERCGAVETTSSVTVSKTMQELITALGWTTSTTKQTFSLDDNVSVKINGGTNTGKAYNGDHIRIYATDSPAGTITISVPTGYELVSVKVSTQTGTYAYLYVDGTTTDICNTTVEVSGSSVVLKSVKNGSDGKQVRVTAIEVTYKPAD